MKTIIKRSGLLIIGILFYQLIPAQNLVINGGFESYSTCPSYWGQITRALNWNSLNSSTPDYFNICYGTGGLVGIPNSTFGYQQTHSGNAYAGIHPYAGPNTSYREYLGGELSGALVAGKCYHFEMYISSANKMQFVTDDIGVYFSTTPLSIPYNYTGPFSVIPEVSNLSGAYPDTVTWKLVSGDFTAAGGEQYLAIGNFKDNNNTTLSTNDPNQSMPYAYFFVDDVSVIECTHSCSASSNLNIRICASELPFTWNGNSYPDPGIFTMTYVTAAGCDSVATLHLSTFPASPTYGSAAFVCSSQLPYIWHGNSYNTAGTYTDTLVNIHGCDSLVTLYLIVNQSGTSVSNIALCPSAFPYTWNGNIYNSAGTYQFLTTAANGCDSVATLNLTMLPASSSTTSENICTGQLPYLWNGNTYTSAGTYSVTLVNTSGCDSLATLVLNVRVPGSSITNINLCQTALPYTWNGNAYNTQGIYNVHLVTTGGCDSLATLNLLILQTSSSNTSVTVCSSQLPYSWNGHTYNATGIYDVILVNTAGCDSVATLNLNVLTSGSSITDVNLCGSSLPYQWNGNSYTVGGTYNVSVTGSNGCDSVAMLHLAVLPVNTSTSDISICSSALPYLWNGQSYTTSGNYSVVLTGANGCDSISTIQLTVNPTPEVNLGNDTTICMGKMLPLSVSTAGATYLWQDGSISSNYNVVKEGIYSVKLSLNGCSNSDTIVVDFKDCDCVPTIPNAFTPNGDGTNDRWIIAHRYCRAKVFVSVYNRYGNQVYHSDNYQDDWKGTYGSKNCPDGTYYYVVKLAYPNQKDQIFKGNVTILR